METGVHVEEGVAIMWDNFKAILKNLGQFKFIIFVTVIMADSAYMARKRFHLSERELLVNPKYWIAIAILGIAVLGYCWWVHHDKH